MIGKEDRVVIGIHDLFGGAFGEFRRVAGWFKDGKLGRVAQIIGRAVAADHVDEENRVGLDVGQGLLQGGKEDGIGAFAVGAGFGRIGCGHAADGCAACGGALVAGVVVPPQHVDISMFQHIHHVFLTDAAVIGIAVAREVGHHAGHGNGG